MAHLLLALFCFLTASALGMTLTRFNNPRQNIWVTFTNLTGQQGICLSLGSVGNPFRTCLVGVPSWSPLEFLSYVSNVMVLSTASTSKRGNETMCDIVKVLNRTLASDPEELEIFGSMNAKNFSGWIDFVGNGRELEEVLKGTRASLFSAADIAVPAAETYDSYRCNASVTAPKQLPKGIFLVCGSRAWNGVPKNPIGGHCYFGKLTLFHPNITQLLLMANHTRHKRSIKDLDCSKINPPVFWNRMKNIMVSTFLPAVSAAKAQSLAKELACFTRDEINRTTQVLDALTSDVASVNHAVLQNRAAIDFLLLAQSHGCDEFEGMCCMNLSTHAESIHKKIADIRNHLSDLKEQTGLGLDGWLQSWGLTGWLKDMFKAGFQILVMVVIFLLCIPCLFSCLQRCLNDMVQRAWHANVAIKENGGSVDSVVDAWLTERGHTKDALIALRP